MSIYLNNICYRPLSDTIWYTLIAAMKKVDLLKNAGAQFTLGLSLPIVRTIGSGSKTARLLYDVQHNFLHKLL